MKFIATFNLPDQTDRNDLATALDYHLGRAYDVTSSSVDATVWVEADYLADLADLNRMNLLAKIEERLLADRQEIIKSRNARMDESFEEDRVGDEDYPYTDKVEFQEQKHDDVLWLRGILGANVTFRSLLKRLQKGEL